ncbi:arylsulfatase [uncultured Faecalicoccus sp.]|uniref:arylsulfatase n=1 Tax=uncultured Faecalicoccus sp. TaxID=1971760 RepID=UPI0026261E16|nr:arylsulfatase [uncultured Faecalicoccus sp.]
MSKPNILLLMCDQFRGDCLSIMGHPDVQTPYLDSIGSQGVVFENAYSATPSCIPARAALLTGRSQTGHGRVGYEDNIDWDYQHYMAEEFSNANYQTQCIGKMHVHPPRLTCGFQGLKLHDGYLGCYRRQDIPHWMHQEVHDDYLLDLKNKVGQFGDVTSSGPECNSFVVHPWIYDEDLHPTNWVADQSIRYLQTRDRTRPFFLMSSFVRPHMPLDPPKSYLDIYKGKDLRPPVTGEWDNIEKTIENQFNYDSIYGTDIESLKKDCLAGYYASITHVDHQIGRILLALQEQGVLEDTIILFVSDHGEMLFDHHLWRKVFPYQGSVHIPFLMRVGKNILKTTSKRITEVVELRDIMPTLLDLCGIDIPETVDGLSLKETLTDTSAHIRDYLHGEHSFHDGLSNHYIVTQNAKYIWYSETGNEQFFDLIKDPNEIHNAINDLEYLDKINELRNCLIKELTGRPENYTDGKHLIPGQKAVNMIKHPQ